MADPSKFDVDEWLSLLDLSAIPDPRDKLKECEFFFDLLSQQQDRERFRWLASAFLNAAYSFFECSALAGYFGIVEPVSGEPVEDVHVLGVLRKHVNVLRDMKRPNYVKTWGLTPLTSELYQFRKKTTHHHPLSIMASGPNLPEDFQFGSMRGKGRPVMPLCREALALVRRVQQEMEE